MDTNKGLDRHSFNQHQDHAPRAKKGNPVNDRPNNIGGRNIGAAQLGELLSISQSPSPLGQFGDGQ